MRVRPVPLLVSIFGAAALTALFVVRQLPREGQVSGAPAAPETATPTPRVSAPAGPADGSLDVRVLAGGEPQAGAEVLLYVASPAEDGAVAWAIASEGRTDASGLARLLARPGAYLVAARAPGLAPGRLEVIRAAGEASTRAEVALEPASALVGRVAARTGGPVPAARVRVIPAVGRWPGFSPATAPSEEVAHGSADAAGSFRVEGLAPGNYAVEVEAAGFHPLLLPRVAVPGGAASLSLEPLGTLEGTALLPGGAPAAGATVRAASADHGAVTAAGPDGRFTLALPAGSYRVHASLGERAGAAPPSSAVAAGSVTRGVEVLLGPAAAIDGLVVRAADGTPVRGAAVAAFLHDTREVAARVRTDGAGRFRIPGLPGDAFDVRVASPGASPALVRSVTLSAGARFPLRIALAGTGSLSGVVRDPSGGPLAGARVRVVSLGDGIVGAASPEARTSFDGEWTLDGIEIGRADLVARQDGVALGASRSVRVEEGRTSRVDFFLPGAGNLTGRVARGAGPLPAGATVVAVAMKAGLGTLQVARTPADATGNYRFTLPAGEYRVHAAPAGATRTDLRAAPSFARVDAGATARLDLPAPDPAPEEGVEILVLEPGGAPSPGAVVTLARPDDGKVAFATSAGEDGRVFLGKAMGLAGRPVTVRARNGGRTGEASVELPATGTVAVPLSPGGTVRGVVLGRARSVSGFTVEVASQPHEGGWRTIDVHRFAGDRFELGDLPAEPLRLDVRSDDGRRGRADLLVASGEIRAVEIAIEGR